ncbi:MAG: hypothetical protein VW714_10595 [Rhodospirillales bacterium]
MTLTLCLHSSAGTPSVFLLSEKEIFLPTLANGTGDPISGPSIAELVEDALNAANISVRDVQRIAVDIGPGRLSAVRAAVAFTNAFAFGLGVPVLPIVSSVALGILSERASNSPAIVVHNSSGGTAFVARVHAGRLESLRHGPVMETIRESAAGLEGVVLVGAPSSILKDVNVVEAVHPEISAEIFRELIQVGEFIEPPVHPITEQSDLIDV